MKERVAVLGAGNGGCAMAAYVASRGACVSLCDLFPQYIADIRKKQGVTLTLEGKTIFQKLDCVTENPAEAIRDAGLILVVTPAFSHKLFAAACASALKDGQIVVLNPGRTGGATEFLHVVRSLGCQKDIVVAETQTLIYSCRKTDGAAVEIYGIKKEVEVGSLPGSRIQEVLDALHRYYPQFTAAKSCLKTSLSNIGALFHPTPVLMNAARIEQDKKDFRYYWEGITPAVATLIHEIDQERVAVAAAYDTQIKTAEQWLQESYDTYGSCLYELIQNNKAYRDIMAPHTLQVRYVTEDVPMSLVPISELGRIAGVPTANMDAVIALTSTIYGQDFRKEGRSLSNMGLNRLSHEQIIRYFETGEAF